MNWTFIKSWKEFFRPSTRWFIIIPLVVIWFFVINFILLVPAVSEIRRAASDRALEIARQARAEIDFTLETVFRDLGQAADEISVEPNRSDLILRRLLKRNPLLVNVALADHNGQEQMRFDRLKFVTSADLETHAKATYFYLALEGSPNLDNVFFSPNLEPHVIGAFPVIRAGKVENVIIAEINLRDLISIAETFKEKNVLLYAVDLKGTIIIHPDISEVIKQTNVFSRPVVQRVIVDGQEADGLASNDSYADAKGTTMFAVGLPLPSTGWGIFIEQPRSQAFSEEWRTIYFGESVAILGTLIIFIVMLGNIRLERLNRQLQELIQELNTTGKILVRRDLELTEANARLQELDALKSEFVSIAAHQLRTPLTGIRWSFLALLEKESHIGSEERRLADNGLKSSTLAIEIVNNLLNVARIEEGKFGFVFREESVGAILGGSVERFQKKAEEKGVRLVLEGANAALPLVLADAEKLGLAFDNLIDNAIKYTSPGGSVSARVFPETGGVGAEIKDTGIGIPAGQQGRIFTKFFRGDNAVLVQTSGSGLGLYLTKNIIDRHGGALSFESVENQGTTFTVFLPSARSQNPAP